MRDRANGCVYMATHNAVSDVDDGVDTQVDIATVSDLVHDHVAAGVPVQLSDIVIAVITAQLDVCMGIGRDNI